MKSSQRIADLNNEAQPIEKLKSKVTFSYLDDLPVSRKILYSILRKLIYVTNNDFRLPAGRRIPALGSAYNKIRRFLAY
jgi:hypothetical protein